MKPLNMPELSQEVKQLITSGNWKLFSCVSSSTTMFIETDDGKWFEVDSKGSLIGTLDSRPTNLGEKVFFPFTSTDLSNLSVANG